MLLILGIQSVLFLEQNCYIPRDLLPVGIQNILIAARKTATFH